MPKTLLLLFFIAVLASAKDKARDWKLGRVLDSTSSKTMLATGASTSTTGSAHATGTSYGTTATATGQSQQTSTTVIHHMTVRDTELLIVGADYAYVIEDPYATSGPLLRRAITNRKHGCRFIIGEDIKYVQDKGKLIVLDPDGKECKLDIVKQERVQRP